jgi:hypothetical protein
MKKFRIEFDNKQIRSIQQTEQTEPTNDTFLEESTGETIWAIVEAENETEAREKAQRLETELQTRLTKRQLSGNNFRNGSPENKAE